MNNESVQRWWLAINGNADGPHGQEYILGLLGSGQVNLATPACAEGAAEWKPLATWSEFAAAGGPAAAPPPPPPPPFPVAATNAAVFSGAAEPVLTNPLLPQMANWICIYCIAVSPVLWFAEYMSCAVTGATGSDDPNFATIGLMLDVLDALKSLAATILLAIGGMRLRRLRASGATLIRTALWIAFIGGAIIAALYIVGGFVTAMGQGDAEAATAVTQQSAAAELLSFALMVIGFGELLFMVTALVWLTRHERELPLIAGT